MVGKLIVKGILRDVAIRKMKAALDGLLIEGLKTNVPLHKVIMNNEQFIKGNYSTNFITTQKPQDSVDTEMDFTAIYKQIAGIEARRMGL